MKDNMKGQFTNRCSKIAQGKVWTGITERTKKIRRFLQETYYKQSLYMYLVLALVLTLVIEMLARKSFWGGIFYLISSPYIFLCNAAIVLMTMSFTILTKRRFFVMSLVSILWLLFGVTNAVLLSKRVTPLTAMDLAMIDTGMKVMNKYFSIWGILLIVVGLVLAVGLIVLTFLKAPKIKHEIKYVRNTIVIVVIWALGIGGLQLGVASGLISTKFGNLRDCYKEYGFVYCFTNSVLNTGVAKPESYSDEKIKEITEQEAKAKKVKKKPNIIFVQLESFFDLNNMKELTFSRNPVPNFENLMAQYPSGYFSVPVVGAGTVNTEFEVMTGMNMDSFGPGEYPFRTILRNTSCESICYNLKEYGYTCHAIHNNTASFYGRNVVFPNLGYDTFTGIENMYISEFTPMGWAKDYYLKDDIIEALKSTQNQDFIYTISVQGHGSYPTDGDYDYPITVSGLQDEDLTHQYQYYAWQTNEMDAFIGELVGALQELGEDTILVMYGDHLPSLGISSEDLVNEDVYQTQYFIWSNFDIDYTDEDIEAYQLEAKILKPLHMTAGKINSYNQQHKDDEDANEYQEGLENLEYDQLYGDYLAYGGINPYQPTQMQIGIHSVTVNSISPLNDNEGSVYVYGKYFTRYSKVLVDGTEQDTVYVDPNILMITDPDLEEGDAFVVCQKNDDNQVVYQTDELIYQQEDKIPTTTKASKKKKSSTKK